MEGEYLLGMPTIPHREPYRLELNLGTPGFRETYR